MPVPKIKRFTTVAQLVNIPAFALEDETGIAEIAIPQGAVILDIVDDARVAGYPGYMIELYKDGNPTSRRFYSRSLNPTTAGRIAVGPIAITAGRISFRCTPTLATSVGDYSFLVKLDR